MKVLNAIEMRKSIRAYETKAVEKEKIDAIVRAGKSGPGFRAVSYDCN